MKSNIGVRAQRSENLWAVNLISAISIMMIKSDTYFEMTRLSRAGLAAVVCLLASVIFCAQSLAQSANGIDIPPPNFTTEQLAAQKGQLEQNPNLTPEQVSVASESYDVARAALENAAANIETAKRLQRELENAPVTVERLREDIEKARSEQSTGEQTLDDVLTGETLLKLQQDLITREGDLRAIRAEIASYNQDLQALLQQPARETLSEARTRLADITQELDAMAEIGELDVTGRARRYALEARQYYRRSQILALEREIAGLSARQQIITHRRDLAQLQAQKTERDVIYLQSLTGQRRLSESRNIQTKTITTLSALETAHPFLRDFAAGNVAVSEKLIRIARSASRSPQQQADARSRSDIIKNDLDIARQLTELGNINRQSSATLRRLRNQRPSANAVKSELERTRKAILTSTQDRLWAQEQLREYPIGQETSAWQNGLEPTMPRLTENDTAVFDVLYAARRDLLAEISDAAFSSVAEHDDLQTLQIELLQNTEDLRGLLDQKLLWLPSVAAIDETWPLKAFRGALDTFSLEKMRRAFGVLMSEGRLYFPLVLIFTLAISAILMLRRKIRFEIKQTAKSVGRVQKDSYWHTPKVVILCGLIAAPIPLYLLLLGVLFKTSASADFFIQSLGQTGIELSGFSWFFLTWREWNREGSLFAGHYSLPAAIRKSVTKQLRWFIPFAGTSIALVTVTQNSREPDIYEGFSLLAFIITAMALSVFGGKILLAKREAFKQAFTENGLLWRYRQPIIFLAIGLPIIAAVLAAAGYYDTARELLSRLFFSAGLLMGTYVVYGVIRRTVVIAQRRLALSRAIERREASLKARQEKEAAEERGEIPPQQVNYEEIDLETISRQSLQLLNTFIVLGFAVLMWIFWQDLLPALSIFDDVQLWQHIVTDSDGAKTEEWVSLWNIMQALVIVVITFVAARNLPGFLEVFILNRSRFDAGTKYAIVSVVGYLIVAIGIIIAFNKLGTEWSQFQWIIAALGVGIGFGLQEIIANFISGLIILFERPVRIGDYVTIGDQSGTITRIQIRATTLADLDNREILIPNKELITGRVTNWTLSNSTTRMIIRVGVAYGTDTDLARDKILEAVEANDRVLEKPKPQVFFLGFGDSSLDFEIRVFLRSFEDRFPVSHKIHTDVNKALDEAGISIPFPQRDLHIITPEPTS